MSKSESEPDPIRAEVKNIAEPLNAAMRSVEEMVVNYTAAVQESKKETGQSGGPHLDVHPDTDLAHGGPK
jgi:hypothetical protein